MSLYSDFELATQELDSLTSEGFFGENAKQLMLQREYLSIYEHLYNCFLDWSKDNNQYGKKAVAHLIMIFLRLYVDAWQGENQDAIDVITSVWKGTPEQPYLECTSSYTEYLRTHVEFTQLIRELGKNLNATVSQKKKLGAALTNAYSKGVEFVGKILTRLVALLQIANGESYDLPALSEMTLHKKIQRFLTLSNGKYDVLVTNLDREVRNAESHLSIYYNTNENVYILKSTTDKGKTGKARKIKPDIMITKIYPFVGWFSQAFVYSAIILVLAHENTERFGSSLRIIKEIGRITEVTP